MGDIGTSPLAVLDLDLANLPDSLELSRSYKGALVLLRLRGRPCGQALLDLRGLKPGNLRHRLMEAADSAFWKTWLKEELDVAAPPLRASQPPRSTVVICTRDRPDDLKRCLAALLAMPDDGQEFLVVDNAPSSDLTRTLVESLSRVRYIREERAGLDNARNRGLREATHDIVAFTDDDAMADPLWLRMLIRNFSDPLVLASTGLTMPSELETDAQILFQRMGGFVRGFKRVTHDAANLDPLMAWHAGAGVSMALRKSVSELVGCFDEALDAGTATMAGGDSDLFRRILAAGYRIVYDPEAVNWHRHRRTMTELEKQVYGYEAAAFAILTKAFAYEGNWGAAAHAFRWARRQPRALARAALRRKGAPPLSIQLAHSRGGFVGPFLYLHARRQFRHG
jgi:GT2 family glycosyltransferase